MRLLTFCLLSLAGTTLWASRGGHVREHTQAATSILLGDVTESISYYGSDGEIYSDVTIRVSASVKETGHKGGRLRTFTVKGGTVGDTQVVFTDVPAFTVDESVVLFMEGDTAREKYVVRDGYIAELGERASRVLDTIEAALDEPMVEGERRSARKFVTETAATEAAAAADSGCYLLIGPKWSTSTATYKIGTTIPSAWSSSLANSTSTWGSAGTVFKFQSDANSANEFLVGAVSSSSTLASTRIEYDGSLNMRKFTMTFSNAVAWTTTGEAGKYDVESVTSHELGHALGLNHPSGSACSEQTLWATAATGETKKRSLENGDKAGLAALYAASTVATPAPTPTTTPTPAPAPAPAPAPTPTAPAAPGFTTTYAFPAVPKAGQSFTLWLLGTGFNTSNVQVILTGPACPSGCIYVPSYKQATMLSVITTLGTKGTYSINVRNGATGLLSATKTLTVQ